MAQRTGSAPVSDTDGRDLIVTVADVKQQVRVTHDEDNDLIEALIRAATSWVEGHVGLVFISRAFRDVWDGFPTGCGPSGNHMPLRWAPVSVKPTVNYTDLDGQALTIVDPDDIVFDGTRVTPIIAPAYGTVWPVAQAIPGAVIVGYSAGVTTADEVDARYKHAVRLIAAHWYRNREAVVTGTISKEIEFAVNALLGPKRRLAV